MREEVAIEIIEALDKILCLKSTKVEITLKDYVISAYDIKNGTVRLDLKVK
jgi:hypothetical protein